MTNEIGRRVWVCLPGTFDKPTVLTSIIAVEAMIEAEGGEPGKTVKSGDDSYIVNEPIGFEAWRIEVR